MTKKICETCGKSISWIQHGDIGYWRHKNSGCKLPIPKGSNKMRKMI